MLCFVMCLSCQACDKYDQEMSKEQQTLGHKDIELTVWYSDSSLTSYLDFIAGHRDVKAAGYKINNVLVSPSNYLKSLYDVCAGEEAPDLYIVSSDVLEEASLMGLTGENVDTAVCNEANYGKAAIEAASYKGRLYGYPLSYNTSVMVYNSSMVGPVKDFTELGGYISSYVPDAKTASVKIIAQWDVMNGFLNYPFVGKYINIAGYSGDDDATDFSSEDFGLSVERFAELKEMLGIDETESTYDICLSMFKKNELIYTLLETKDLRQLKSADVSYGVAPVPDYSSVYGSKAMSTTTLALVNPYLKDNSSATEYAKMLTYDYSEYLFTVGGLTPARGNIEEFVGTPLENAHKVYSETVVKSQLAKTGDTYMQLEVLLHDAWNGENITDSMNNFQKYMRKQWLGY